MGCIIKRPLAGLHRVRGKSFFYLWQSGKSHHTELKSEIKWSLQLSMCVKQAIVCVSVDLFFALQAAMDFVVEEDLKAHLTCWYIQKYVKENPHPHYLEHIIH